MKPLYAPLLLLLSAPASSEPTSALDLLRQGGFPASAEVNAAGLVIAPSPLERPATDVDADGYVSHVPVTRPKDAPAAPQGEPGCQDRSGLTREERKQCEKDNRPTAAEIAARLGVPLNLGNIDARSCPGARGTSLCIGPKWKW